MSTNFVSAQASDALNDAALAIAGNFSLDKVLNQIVTSARQLVNAQYGALGVPNSDGNLVEFVHSGMSADEAAAIEHPPKGRGALGALIREKKPIRLRRVSDDPRSVGFPPHHLPMSSFLGVPILYDDVAVGNLYLTNKLDGDEFTAADQKLAEMLAAHAAIAIKKAQLHEEIQRLAIVEERARIGMDLHDGVIQSIYAVGLTLESARLILPANATQPNQLITSAIDGLNDTISDIRNFILDLRPRHFSGDLIQGLGQLEREFQANTMVQMDVTIEPEAAMVASSTIARALYMTAQEALANIARHAKATQVYLELKRTNAGICLRIGDNGKGFNPAAIDQSVGHGLQNMRARAQELGGSFDLQTAPGQGASVQVEIPL